MFHKKFLSLCESATGQVASGITNGPSIIFLEGCHPQILLGPFLNTLSRLCFCQRQWQNGFSLNN